ncbi:AMP-binding protein [Streptomyces sp. NPDC015131]|uniref:AMP-binding protein n=1 Tax=Streptomyces sp. NPDC015131 TaxID=3364941 RepID=UPI003700DF7D
MLDGCTPWPEEFTDRYWMAGHWQGYTLDDLLRGWAVRYGPRTAVVGGDTRLTYAQLNRRADRMAAGFRLRGLRPGQRVIVQLPNVPEFVVTVFALIRAGAVPVLCPVSYGAGGVSRLVRVSEAVGWVVPPEYRGVDLAATAAQIAAEGPFLRRVFTYEAPGASSPYGGMTIDPAGCHSYPLGSIDAPPEPATALGAGQVALLLLAGGAGEAPALVPRTHNDYACQARAAAEAVSLTEDDVYLAALPAAVNLAFGCPGILGTLSVGGTVVMVEDLDPAACLAAVARERVTVASLLPETARAWRDAGAAVRAEAGSLRLVQIGGAPEDPVATEPVPALGCATQRIVDLAEGLVTTAGPTGPGEPVPTTYGRPLSPGDELRVVDRDGRDAADGRPGELLARGPHIVRGYYRTPDRTARSFTPDGYFRTGLLAARTPGGEVTVVGRLAEASVRR